MTGTHLHPWPMKLKFGFARAASQPEHDLLAVLQSPLNDVQLVEDLQAGWEAAGAFPALADLGSDNPLPRISWLFDAGSYLERNADVAEAGFEPYIHFLQHGLAEQRDPHPLVDLAYIRGQLGLPGLPVG